MEFDLVAIGYLVPELRTLTQSTPPALSFRFAANERMPPDAEAVQDRAAGAEPAHEA